MNIQTELTEQHVARLTVEVDPAKLAAAKQKAARQLSQRVNIPGFRKGKAPYQVLVRMIGEPAILEEAVEIVSNDIYKDVLLESGVKPYTSGSIEDVQWEEPIKITFGVPLVPEVTLNDYRAVRLPYELPAIDDEAVNRALVTLQEQNAVVEPSSQPAVDGDRLTLDINAVFVKDETAEAAADTETPAAEQAEAAEVDHAHADHDHADHDHDHDHEHDGDGPDLHALSEDMDGEQFMHEHNYVATLGAASELLPGFSAALTGASAGDVRKFTLTIPEDSTEYEEVAGEDVNFLVVVKKVEKQTLPELNDDFAARVTAEEATPLTLLELRMRVRENLETSAKQRYETDYARQALDAIVEQASVKYPPVMLDEEVERYLGNLDQNMRQSGLTLEMYMQIYRKSKEELAAQYREPAAKSLARSLVMGEMMAAERLSVTASDIEAQIDKLVTQFGEEQRDQIRQMFTQQEMYESLATDVLNTRIRERIALIARGEAPELPAAVPTPSADASPADEPTAVVTQENSGSEEKGESA